MTEDMIPAPPEGRREARKRERRAAIVAAARSAFLTEGYAAMSMSGLLDVLGGSKSTLWSYFPSKEELFAAVLEEAAASLHGNLAEVLSEDTPLEQGVRAFARAFIDTIETPNALALWRLVVAESARLPELGLLFYERAASGPERLLAAFLERFVGTGLRDEDPQQMAAILIGLCGGHVHERLFGITHGGPDAREAAALRFSEVFLRAYGRPGDGAAERGNA